MRRAITVATLLLMAVTAGVWPAAAQTEPGLIRLEVTIGKSQVIDLKEPFTRVSVTNPNIADVFAIREDTYRRFPFFKSTKMEQRMMFGRPAHGEPAPLTILPTAKYWSDAA